MACRRTPSGGFWRQESDVTTRPADSLQAHVTKLYQRAGITGAVPVILGGAPLRAGAVHHGRYGHRGAASGALQHRLLAALRGCGPGHAGGYVCKCAIAKLIWKRRNLTNQAALPYSKAKIQNHVYCHSPPRARSPFLPKYAMNSKVDAGDRVEFVQIAPGRYEFVYRYQRGYCAQGDVWSGKEGP